MRKLAGRIVAVCFLLFSIGLRAQTGADSLTYYLSSSRTAMVNEEFSSALLLLNRAEILDKKTEYPEVIFNKAFCYFMQDFSSEAKNELTRFFEFIEADNDVSDSLLGNAKWLEAKLFQRELNYPNAVISINQAINLIPSRSQFYLSRAEIYYESFQEDSFNNCLNDLRNFLNVFPESIEGNYLLGRIYYELELYMEANSYLMRCGDYLDSRFMRGVGYYLLHDYDSCYHELNTDSIVMEEQDEWYYFYCLGVSAYHLKKFDLAKEYLVTSSNLGYSKGDIYYHFGRIHLAEWTFDEAIRSFSKAIRINSDDSFYWAYRSKTYFELEKYKKALLDINEAIHLNEDNYFFHSLAAEIYIKLNDDQKALFHINKSISVIESYPELLGAEKCAATYELKYTILKEWGKKSEACAFLRNSFMKYYPVLGESYLKDCIE